MAMLAEPRRRQKIGPNPRGKFFLEDDENKGRVMLSKLGWQKGDGLGRQNQGMQAPICPKIQMDGKGLGFDPKSDPWIAHTQEFSQILENLQAVHNVKAEEAVEDSKAVSFEEEEERKRKLEKKSKSSKVRIHYHKFVKSKDVSNFSHTDLKCIFGKPSDALIEKPVASVGSNVGESKEDLLTEDGVKTINCGSMADYFQNKMKEKEKKIIVEKVEEEQNPNVINRGSMFDYFKAKMAERKLKALQIDQAPIMDESVNDVKPDCDLNEGTNLQDENVFDSETPNKKRKRDKKKASDDISEDDAEIRTGSEGSGDMQGDPAASVETIKRNKKSKRQDESAVAADSSQDLNPAIIPEVVESTVNEVVKKSKKMKPNQSGDMELHITLEEDSLSIDPGLEESTQNETMKKPNKKKKNKADNIELGNEVEDVQPINSELEESKENETAKKSKKRKKNKSGDDELDAEVEDVKPIVSDLEESVENERVKKAKKKNKSKSDDIELDAKVEDVKPVVSELEMENDETRKSKKKKSKKSDDIELDVELEEKNEIQSGNPKLEDPTESQAIKKSKKRKQSEIDLGVKVEGEVKPANKEDPKIQSVSSELDELPENRRVKREKKKKKSDDTELETKLDDQSSSACEESKLKKRKKSKRKHSIVEQDDSNEVPPAKKSKNDDIESQPTVEELLEANKIQNFIKKEKRKKAKEQNPGQSQIMLVEPEQLPCTEKKKKKYKVAAEEETKETIPEIQNVVNKPNDLINSNSQGKNHHPTPKIKNPPAPTYFPLNKKGQLDKHRASVKHLKVVGKNFPGANLNKINGYALY